MGDPDDKKKGNPQLQNTLIGFPSFSPEDLKRKCPKCEKPVLPPDQVCPFCGADMASAETK